LIGHSRGGQAIDRFAREEIAEGQQRIKALFALAPGVTFAYEDQRPDIPYGIVVTEFDRDVGPADGQTEFDSLFKETNRQSPASIVYLRGGNHAFFNREFTEDDAANVTKQRLTRPEQEDFALHYVAAFLAVYVQGKQPFGIFDPTMPVPDTVFGKTAASSLFWPSAEQLITVDAAKAGLTASGGADLSYVEAKEGSDVLFHHPAVSGETVVYRLNWSGQDGEVTISTPAESDFSNDFALSLFLAIDSSDPANPADQPQALTVSLGDAAGGQASIVLPPQTAALAYHVGEREHFEGDSFDLWRGWMPLSEVRIPLNKFTGVALDQVTSVTLQFNQTTSGTLMLSRAQILKPAN
jgi:hypothetical protein